MDRGRGRRKPNPGANRGRKSGGTPADKVLKTPETPTLQSVASGSKRPHPTPVAAHVDKPAGKKRKNAAQHADVPMVFGYHATPPAVNHTVPTEARPAAIPHEPLTDTIEVEVEPPKDESANVPEATDISLPTDNLPFPGATESKEEPVSFEAPVAAIEHASPPPIQAEESETTPIPASSKTTTPIHADTAISDAPMESSLQKTEEDAPAPFGDELPAPADVSKPDLLIPHEALSTPTATAPPRKPATDVRALREAIQRALAEPVSTKPFSFSSMSSPVHTTPYGHRSVAPATTPSAHHSTSPATKSSSHWGPSFGFALPRVNMPVAPARRSIGQISVNNPSNPWYLTAGMPSFAKTSTKTLNPQVSMSEAKEPLAVAVRKLLDLEKQEHGALTGMLLSKLP